MGALHTHTHVLFFTAAPGAPPQEDSTPASSPQASAAPSVPYERRPPLPTTPRSLARHRPASGKALTCRTPAPTGPTARHAPGAGPCGHVTALRRVKVQPRPPPRAVSSACAAAARGPGRAPSAPPPACECCPAGRHGERGRHEAVRHPGRPSRCQRERAEEGTGASRPAGGRAGRERGACAVGAA